MFIDLALSRLRDQVNGRGFEDRKYFGTLHKPKVGDSLAGNEGNKFETDIYDHFGQNAGRHDIGYASLQVIACAALLSASLLERHVFTADADVEVDILSRRFSGSEKR